MMETYCAEIQDGLVVRVLVASSADACAEALGGTWVDCHTFLPGIGWSWDGADFHPPITSDGVEQEEEL